MTKHFKTLIVMLLLCLYGTGWAQTTLDLTTGTWNLPITQSSYTISGDKGTGSNDPTYSSSNYDVRFYALNTMTITNTKGKISKIVFYMSTTGKAQWGELSASCGSTKIDKTNGTTTWEYTEGTESVSFKVSDKNTYGTAGTSKYGMFCFNKIEIYRSDIILTNLSFGESTNKTFVFKGGVLGGFVTPKASVTKGYEGNVVYTSSDKNIINVDETTGRISFTGYGKADITATFVPDDPDTYLTTSDKYAVVNWKKTEAGRIVFSSEDKSFETVGTNYNKGDFAFVASDGKTYTFNTTNAANTKGSSLLRLKNSSATSPTFSDFSNGYTVKVTYSTPSNGSITLKSGTNSTTGKNGGKSGTGMEVSITTDNSEPFTISTSQNPDVVLYISRIEITTNSPSTIDLDELYANGIIAQESINVTLKRTMVANEWNTICLPFSVTAEQARQAFGKDVKIAALDPNKTEDKNVLAFNFVNTMEAGTPYIIKPTTESPANGYTFDGVKTTNASPSVVKSKGGIGFVGIYDPVDITSDVSKNSALTSTTCYAAFLGDGDRLYKASDNSTTKGFRAYFAIPENVSSAMYIAVDGATTSIADIHTDCDTDVPTYTLQGQRVNNSGNRGIYIKKGKKFIVR